MSGAATRCPYGDEYAHSLFDLVPARPWDESSTAKATRPCPLGFACPEYAKPIVIYSSTTSDPGPSYYCNGCRCYHAGPRCYDAIGAYR